MEQYIEGNIGDITYKSELTPLFWNHFYKSRHKSGVRRRPYGLRLTS